MKIQQNKWMSYCAIPAGLLSSAASVSGQTVIFYGIDTANDTSADPAGIAFAAHQAGLVIDGAAAATSQFGVFDGIAFSQGADLMANNTLANDKYGVYTDTNQSGFINGAQMGDQNFVNVSFGGVDGLYEAVAQFSFDGAGGGFLVAIAFENDVITGEVLDPLNLSNAETLTGATGTFSISAGAAAIAASVPEPSSLALLALGATGLMTRRQRKAA